MRRLALVVVLLLGLPSAGCIRDFDEQEPDNHLRLRSIDVSAPEVRTGSVALVVNATLDNRAAESGDVQLRVKAFDRDTGFLERTETTANRTFAEDTTVTVGTTLDLPRRSGYRIEVDVYQDGQLVETGRVTVHNLDSLEPTVHETGLEITTMEFLVRNVTSDRVRVESQIYLTNEGSEPSRPLRMQVKARDLDTGLLADQVWTDVGAVPPEETRIHDVELDVPDEHNYAVEVVLWDGNLSVEQRTGTVQLLPTTVRNASEEIEVTDPRIEDFLGDEDERSADRGGRAPADEGAQTETPGPGAVAALAAVALAAFAAWWRDER